MNKENIQSVYPMSDIQRGMVYATLMDPESAVYHDQFVYYSPLIEEVDRFTRAVELMIDIHPILRTSFNLESFSEQVQVLHKKINPKLYFKDLTIYPEKKQEAYLKDYMLKERYQPYDFTNAPLWRIGLFNINNDTTVYLIQFHHAILDGWSLASFNTQLFNIYNQLKDDKNYIPSHLKCSIKDAVIEEIAEKRNSKTINYWENKLKGYKKLNIFSSAQVLNSSRKKMSPALSEKLRAFSLKNGLQYRNVILGAFAYVFKAVTSQEDFILGIVSNTRPPIEDSDKLLGCFLNTLPKRFSFEMNQGKTWMDYFRSIEEEMLEFRTKDRSTLYEISKRVGKEKGNENPFFDIMYNYVDFNNAYKNVKDSASNEKDLREYKENDLESFLLTNTFLDITVLDSRNSTIGFDLLQSRAFNFDFPLDKIGDYVEKIISNYLINPEDKINETVFLATDDIDRKYWWNIMSNDLPILNLPSNKQRPAIKTQNGQQVLTFFKKENTEAVSAYVNKNGGSLFTFLLSSLKVLLYRYSGQEDIVVGTLSGSNFMPLRNSVDGNLSFDEFYKNVEENLLEAQIHNKYTYAKLVKELKVENDPSRNPLFDIIAKFQKLKNTATATATATATDAEFDLLFNFLEIQDDLGIELTYNKEVYDTDTITKLIAHYQQLIEEIVARSNSRIGSIDYLTGAEKSEMLFGFNQTDVAFPKDKTVVDLFEEQAEKTPDKIAIFDNHKSYSYRELKNKTDVIAACLVEETGIEKEPIGVILERSADLLVILLSVLKSGKSYIPIDPNLPRHRVEYIIENSKSKVIIANKKFKEEGLLKDEVKLIEEEFLLSKKTNSKEKFKTLATDTAYVIYTSGSTGNPKGVEIGHRSLVNFLTSIKNTPGITEEDILYAVTTYSFDISILEFFAPLITGAAVFIATDDILSDPNLIIENMEKIKPTIVQATPSFYQMLFNAGWKGNKGIKVLCGGDALSKSLAEKLMEQTSQVWNMYGPTETTIWSTIKKIEKPSHASNIGQPLNNTQIYILDRKENMVPHGVTGKIFIAGDGLAKGYFNNDKLTKERFVDNPFASKQNKLNGTSLMYDTGDVGKWLPDGSIEFQGRDDHQVKIRGHRIELGEIENVLLQYSKDIKQVVLMLKEGKGEKSLIAYYTAISNIDKSALKDFLLNKLPGYMVPTFYKVLDEMPLTPNGKINRKALPEIADADIIRGEYVQPQNEMEETIIEIIKKELGNDISKIGVTDNFFDIGMDSLSAIKILNQINKKLDLELKPLDLFQYPNVQSLISNLLQLETEDVPFLENISEDIDSIVDMF